MQKDTEQQAELGYEFSTRLVNQVVERNYLTNLNQMTVSPLNLDEYKQTLNQVRLFKISEIVFEEKENITQKLANVYNALANRDNSVFLLIDANREGVSLYIGVRQQDPKLSIVTSAELIQKSLIGQFPGIKLEVQPHKDISMIQNKMNRSTCIASVSGIPMIQTKELGQNAEFIQGLEKVINSLQGERYECLVLASSIGKSEINDLRLQYENIYSQLVPLKKMTVTYGKNKSYSLANGNGSTSSTSRETTNSVSYTFSHTNQLSKSTSKSRPAPESEIAKGAAEVLNVVSNGIRHIAPLTGKAGLVAVGVASVAEVAGDVIKEHYRDRRVSTSEGAMKSSTNSQSRSTGTNYSESQSTSKSTTETNQIGNNRSWQADYENKTVSNMLKRLDLQFERMDQFDDTSAWESAVYVMSEEADVTEMAASTFQSIMSGDHSGVQVTTVNSWLGNGRVSYDQQTKISDIKQYLTHFLHPEFVYDEFTNVPMALKATSIVSSQELAIELGLPRHSVVGVPVIQHAKFAQNVFQPTRHGSEIKLGNIYQVGTNTSKLPAVRLQMESLTGHAFITGSTGTGKSNTIYRLLSEAMQKKIHFLVIEPAKGEYKHVFGNRKDVNVFGTNPNYTPLLRLNPFAFPKGVHIYEHIDRLIEIFNVSWPMYAAMPAILKKAVISAYQKAGWNLTTSQNSYHLYPNFGDLIDCLKEVINESDYSAESKGNYIGSLVTRVESLANGLNGMIFTSDEIGDKVLFDENTIIDLSRVGSGETKSLIMGILVMRLSEYRMDDPKLMNANLQHLTVLEEAHNILKKATDGGPEGTDVTGKSIEMLTNAIAEMRTYGEGFMIADQTPAAVDPAAIRNTNTKIIMRLPDFNDRELVGRAAALNDKQLNEIALLPRGVGVVYQNDWLEPVLCAIDLPDNELIQTDGRYQYEAQHQYTAGMSLQVKKMVYALIFVRAIRDIKKSEVEKIKRAQIENLPVNSVIKMILLKQRDNYRTNRPLTKTTMEAFCQVVGIEKKDLNRNKEALNKITENPDITSKIIELSLEEL